MNIGNVGNTPLRSMSLDQTRASTTDNSTENNTPSVQRSTSSPLSQTQINKLITPNSVGSPRALSQLPAEMRRGSTRSLVGANSFSPNQQITHEEVLNKYKLLDKEELSGKLELLNRSPEENEQFTLEKLNAISEAFDLLDEQELRHLHVQKNDSGLAEAIHNVVKKNHEEFNQLATGTLENCGKIVKHCLTESDRLLAEIKEEISKINELPQPHTSEQASKLQNLQEEHKELQGLKSFFENSPEKEILTRFGYKNRIDELSKSNNGVWSKFKAGTTPFIAEFIASLITSASVFGVDFLLNKNPFANYMAKNTVYPLMQHAGDVIVKPFFKEGAKTSAIPTTVEVKAEEVIPLPARVKLLDGGEIVRRSSKDMADLTQKAMDNRKAFSKQQREYNSGTFTGDVITLPIKAVASGLQHYLSKGKLSGEGAIISATVAGVLKEIIQNSFKLNNTYKFVNDDSVEYNIPTYSAQKGSEEFSIEGWKKGKGKVTDNFKNKNTYMDAVSKIGSSWEGNALGMVIGRLGDKNNLLQQSGVAAGKSIAHNYVYEGTKLVGEQAKADNSNRFKTTFKNIGEPSRVESIMPGSFPQEIDTRVRGVSQLVPQAITTGVEGAINILGEGVELTRNTLFSSGSNVATASDRQSAQSPDESIEMDEFQPQTTTVENNSHVIDMPPNGHEGPVERPQSNA